MGVIIHTRRSPSQTSQLVASLRGPFQSSLWESLTAVSITRPFWTRHGKYLWTYTVPTITAVSTQLAQARTIELAKYLRTNRGINARHILVARESLASCAFRVHRQQSPQRYEWHCKCSEPVSCSPRIFGDASLIQRPSHENLSTLPG